MLRIRCAVAAAAAAALFPAAACAGSGAGPVESSPDVEQDGPGAHTAGSGAAAAPSRPDGSDPFAGRILDENHGLDHGRFLFTSANGAFSCGIVSGSDEHPAYAGCAGSTQPVPPRPDSCPPGTGWGGGMSVDAVGNVAFRCADGAGYDAGAQVLPYGSVARALGFSCASHREGIYCRDNPSGHGFMIAPEDNTTF